jgi:hypothetical protein
LADQRRAELEAELHGPPLPPAAAYLWGWWSELHEARGAGGMGLAAITYPDIEAWCRLRGIRLAPWETAMLTALDRAYRTAMAKRSAT